MKIICEQDSDQIDGRILINVNTFVAHKRMNLINFLSQGSKVKVGSYKMTERNR